MVRRIRRVLGCEGRGASAVEYGLLLAAIAPTIVLTVFALGSTIRSTLYDDRRSNIKGGAAGPQAC